jgi:N-methylhydantoinase A
MNGLGEVVGFTKVPSTLGDPSIAVMDVVGAFAESIGTSVQDVLRRCGAFIHGTTVATNTLLEGKGARVALLCTKGFRDSLTIRRGARRFIWDVRSPNPPDLVPRYRRIEVVERTQKTGEIEIALKPDTLEFQLEQLRNNDVDSIAVCFFNSFLNPANEVAAAELIRERLPRIHVSISSEILPIMGEYERTATTVVDAYVGPRLSNYLSSLEQRLVDGGFLAKLLVTASNGGVVDVEYCRARPVTAILSGPAAGAPAAMLYSKHIKSPNVLLMDMGGTSCDVTLAHDGRVAVTDSLVVGGYDVAVRSVDINTIGTGGGSVAWVDAGGLLHVGPRGTGAEPGPACYGKGGNEATVTDANLVIGHLTPDGLLAGRIPLHAELAYEAISRRIASPLGMGVLDAALGIIRVGNQNMLSALRKISIQRGHDPRKFTLIAAGGAGPLHAPVLARALAIPFVYVPRVAPAFCALGMLGADVRHDYVQAYLKSLSQVESQHLVRMFEAMKVKAAATLTGEGFSGAEVIFHTSADLRYRDQQWEVEVGVDASSAAAPGDLPLRLAESFHAQHATLYGHANPSGIVEIVRLRLTALALTPEVRFHRESAHAESRASSKKSRNVYSGKGVSKQVPVFRGEDLHSGEFVIGPALVDDPATTVLVQEGDTLNVDELRNFMIAVGLT